MSIGINQISSRERQVAFLIGVATATVLALRVALSVDEYGGLVDALTHLTQFFTILTNATVMILMFAISSGRKISQLLTLSVVVVITGVGTLYHLLLAHLWSPEGFAWLADQGVHTLIPVVTILWWLMYAIKARYSYKQSLFVIVWPIAYTCYALLRAAYSGVYPYPFLNLDTLGWANLMLNILVISAGFLFLGLLFITINNLILNSSKTISP